RDRALERRQRRRAPLEETALARRRHQRPGPIGRRLGLSGQSLVEQERLVATPRLAGRGRLGQQRRDEPWPPLERGARQRLGLAEGARPGGEELQETPHREGIAGGQRVVAPVGVDGSGQVTPPQRTLGRRVPPPGLVVLDQRVAERRRARILEAVAEDE